MALRFIFGFPKAWKNDFLQTPSNSRNMVCPFQYPSSWPDKISVTNTDSYHKFAQRLSEFWMSNHEKTNTRGWLMMNVDSFEWPEKQKPLLAVHGANVPWDKGWLCWTWLAKHGWSVTNHWFLPKEITTLKKRPRLLEKDQLDVEMCFQKCLCNLCSSSCLHTNGEGCWMIDQ